MGTRNLTCAVVGGEFKLAQYCQWDGYPEGQGSTVYNFVKSFAENEGKEEDFRSKLRQSRFISDEEFDALWQSVFPKKTDGWMTIGESDKWKNLYPTLQRDLGAKILELISQKDELVPLQNNYEFGYDGLFCEWAYVIDLDNRILEVYEGFHMGNVNPEDARWPGNSQSRSTNEEYGPIVKIIQWSFDKLPENVDEFVKEIESLTRKRCDNG